MTPDDAYATLAEILDPAARHRLPVRLDDAVTAWAILDSTLRADGDLPYPWARLTALAAAHRAGHPDTATWQTLVRNGYAPAADGEDSAGRAWWHPATVDAYVNGTWIRPPKQRDPDEQPPMSGTGASRDSWAAWAATRGVTVETRMNRDQIQQACRELGIIN